MVPGWSQNVVTCSSGSIVATSGNGENLRFRVSRSGWLRAFRVPRLLHGGVRQELGVRRSTGEQRDKPGYVYFYVHRLAGGSASRRSDMRAGSCSRDRDVVPGLS